MASAKRSWKEKQYQERERYILQVAEATFIEKGYHSASMEEIAEQVGIAKGTLYLHFSSKEDLAIAILVRDVEQHFLTILETVLRSKQATHAKLETVLSFLYRDIFGKHLPFLSVIYTVIDLLPEFAAHETICLKEPYGAMRNTLFMLLEEGKASGELDSTLPTEVLLQMFLSFFSLKHYGTLLVHHHMDPDEIVHTLMRLYFQGANMQ